MKPFTIYLIGVGLLGGAYHWLKCKFSDPVFLVICLSYLLALRFVVMKFGKVETIEAYTEKNEEKDEDL